MLSKVNDIDFNCFEFDKQCKGDGLSTLVMNLFQTNDLFEKLNIEPIVLNKFIKVIQNG